MRYKVLKYFATALILILVGCRDFLLNGEPENTFEENFEEFWKTLDEQYVGIHAYNVNWDSVYISAKAELTNVKNENQLFSLFITMSKPFKDFHFRIKAKNKGSYNYNSNAPVNFLGTNLVQSYLKGGLKGNTRVKYGQVSDSIVYMHIANFVGLDNEDFKVIDQILLENLSSKAFIVDVRNNGGGNEANAKLVASRFTSKECNYAYFRAKSGKKHDDFSDFKVKSFGPNGAIQFLKPVFLLTNKYVASSSESFAYMMRCLPNVVQVGDNTAGLITSMPIDYELPNGWSVWISIGLSYDTDKKLNTDGLIPHHKVSITAQDSLDRKDRILEKAIMLANM